MKVLWICFVWPEPQSSAAGVRTMQLIDTCLDEGWEVHVASPCVPNEHHERLKERGIPTQHFEANDSSFDTFVHDLAPDVVFFDRFMIEEQFGWRVREQCPDAARVLDTVDIHSLRRIRQARVERGESALGTKHVDLQTDDAIRELSAIYRSDLSLVVSDFELELLGAQYGVPSELVELNPIHYPEPIAGPSFEERANFAMIGNFRHAPNLDACRLLQRELWKLIRGRLPKAELHIYGAYPPKELMDQDDPASGFRVLGRARDVHETLARYRVNLAPLRFGAGIKGKVLDGWAVGTPCMSTLIGAEGLTGDFHFGGTICATEGDWNGFADAAADLYENPVTWDSGRQNGAAILRARFSREEVIEGFISRIRRLVHEKTGVRSRNFVGAMLWHHGARSTEYFSRWIETKSRLKEAQGHGLSSPPT